MIGGFCPCRKSSTSSICRAHRRTLSSASLPLGPSLSSTPCKSPPATNAITRYCREFSAKWSISVGIPGCDRRASTLASRVKSSIAFFSWMPSPTTISLTATGRFASRVSLDRYTRPIPPTPSTFLTRYRPSRRWPSVSSSPAFMAIVSTDPPQLPRTRLLAGATGGNGGSRYRFYHQLEERFPDDHLVARLEFGGTARREPRLAIHVGAVETADVLDRDLACVDSNQCMLARDLGLGIVGVEIHFRKRSGLRIPSAYQVVAVFERELLALASAANDRQLRLERRACRGRSWRRTRGGSLRFDLTGRRFRPGHFGRRRFGRRRFGARSLRRRRSRRRVRVGAFSSGWGRRCFRSRAGSGGGRRGTAGSGELRAASVAVIKSVHIFVAAFAAFDHGLS